MVEIRLSEAGMRGAIAVMRTIAEESHDCRSFVTSALERLPALVASDLTTLSLCHLGRASRDVFGRPGETLSDADLNAFDRHFRSHPLVRFHSANRHAPTQRVSDCSESGNFRDTPVYADYYARIGIKHVMALPLQIDENTVISIVLNRSGSDFADAEREMLETLRPALSCLYRNLIAREDAAIALRCIGELAASGNWHVLRVTASGVVLEAAAPARGLLRQFFAHEHGARGAQLPMALTEWISRSRNWGLDRLAARDSESFTVSRRGTKLTGRFIADRFDAATGYLLLRKESEAVRADQLASLPLTRREREVLAFVAAGKTNAEIAGILGNSARTVQKHMEHVFQKLGVETRTAAAVRALTAADATGLV
jgi:DNA-binding CsgD family transcriptional regulator